MPDREKVIKGLECCTKKVCIYIDTEKECPYCELCGEYEDAFEDCTTALAKDTIALLKAQEPRVMTVANIVGNYVAPEVVWVEVRNNKVDIRLIAGLWNGEYYNMADGSVMYDLSDEIADNPEGYNTLWRCWTSRPDEKRRAETPWESVK